MMKVRRSGAIVLVAGLAWTGCAVLKETPAVPALGTLDSPAPVNSGQPRLAASGDRAVLSWIESSEDASTLKFSERIATGWSAPQVIPTSPGLVVNAADVPLVQPLPNGMLAAQWVEEEGEAATVVRLAWSKDGGRSWSAPITPHRDRTETEHGFGSIFETSGGGFGLIWLDGRAMTPGADEGDMALWGTAFGPDGTQGPEAVVDTRVCECCQTATAVTAEGPVVVYRDRSAAEVRDIALSRLTAAGWTAPTRVHNDGWKIEGCPVNGPAIAAAGQDVAVVWFTAESGQARTLLAFSRDAGRTFGAPVRVDDGEGLGHVQVGLAADGSAVVSWIESTKPGSALKARRIARDGARSAAIQVADMSSTDYPRMAVRGDELLFAWSDRTPGAVRVRTARAGI